MYMNMISTAAASVLKWAGLTRQHIEIVSRHEPSVPAVNCGGALAAGIVMERVGVIIFFQ